jgi:hypothetical protein
MSDPGVQGRRRAAVLALALAAIAILAAGLGYLVLDRSAYRLVDGDQLRFDPAWILPLEVGAPPVGQTFVARHAGLAGVEFYLVPSSTGTRATIRLHLRADAQATEDLLTTSAELPANAPPGFYRFSFPPLDSSHGRYFYAFLETGEAAGGLALGAGGAYLDGAVHQDHRPLDAQGAFRLVYAPGPIALDLLQRLGHWLILLAGAGLLFVVPGLALLAWLRPAPGEPGEGLPNPAADLALAAGLGLALYPLLFLWADVVSLRLGRPFVWLLLAVCAAAWAYRAYRPQTGRRSRRAWSRPEVFWPNVALLLVMALVFAVRLLVIGTIDIPLWGDSYQNTMIVQLMFDHGGLFNSWEPYAPLQSFTYHFGFHAAATAFGWLSGQDAPTTVLWTGQILNGLAIFSLYPLAVRISRNRWAGVVAVLIAGLLSPLPMGYTNWGRYAQLAGQVLLPVAVYFTWSALEAPRRDWRRLALSGILVAALAMTHFRIVILYALFVVAWLILSLRRANWRAVLGRLAWLGLGVTALSLPWAVRLLSGRLAAIFVDKMTTSAAQAAAFDLEANAIGDLTTYLAPGLWLLLGLAVAVGLWRRRRGVWLVAAWWLLGLLASNPERLGLPGTAVIGNFSLFIAIYIPAGLLIGDLAGQILTWPALRRLPGLALPLLILAVGLAGARERMGDVQPAAYTLVTRPDLRAMDWIEANTPGDSRFLVNGFFAYGGTIYVGSDGGWWLPLLAGRENTVPPINYGPEAWPTADYGQRLHALPQQLAGRDLGDPEVLNLLADYDITHVFVGQRQGRVNYGGPYVIDPKQMLASDSYRLLYHQDRVWVFEIIP